MRRLWARFKAWAVQEHRFCAACGDSDATEELPNGEPLCPMCAYLLAFNIAGNRAIRRARARR